MAAEAPGVEGAKSDMRDFSLEGLGESGTAKTNLEHDHSSINPRNSTAG